MCRLPNSRHYSVLKTLPFTNILVPICLHCLNCTKFGRLIIMKIFTIVAMRCHILRPKCIKFDFGWGCAPDPAVEAHSAPPDLPEAGNTALLSSLRHR